MFLDFECLVYRHGADDTLCLCAKSVLGVDVVHQILLDAVGSEDDNDLLFRVEGNTSEGLGKLIRRKTRLDYGSACSSCLAGCLVLGDVLSKREIVGCVLVFAAILLAQIPMPGKRREER